MLRFLPRHKHFHGPTAQITDPPELAIAKDKLLLSAQSEWFPADVKQLQSGVSVKSSYLIASYSPFIAPGGIIRSTGQIQRLARLVLKLSISSS